MINEIIRDFTGRKKLAIVGASTERRKFGNIVYRDLRAKGYEVFPVNPKSDTVEGDRCYPSLKALPEPVDGIVLIIPGEKAAQVIQEAYECGIRRTWMQPGAESQDAIALCSKLGIDCIYDKCIMKLT